MRDDGERFGKGREVVMCCGKEDNGVVDGREMLMDFVRGAMGDKTMLIRSSMTSMSNSSVEGELD
jgi:hypothetical protein